MSRGQTTASDLQAVAAVATEAGRLAQEEVFKLPAHLTLMAMSVTVASLLHATECLAPGAMDQIIASVRRTLANRSAAPQEDSR